MSLKPVVDALDSIAAEEQSFYAKAEDGKFYLDVDKYTTGLRSALEKERTARKDFEKKAKRADEFEGLDPTEVRSLIDKVNGDERMRLIKDGKFEEAMNLHAEKQTEKMRKEYERQLKAVQDAAAQAEQKAQRYTQRALDSALREAAASVGMHPYAVEDALMRGRSMFSIDDEGNAVQLDQDGGVVKGKNGKTPFTPAEWLESMREVAPHWFPASGTGSGSQQGNSRGSVRGKVIKRSAFDQMGPAERVATIKEGITVID